MQIYRAVPGEPIPLGRRWEHHARRIVFDISGWVETFGAGTVTLLHQRQGDEVPYPVPVTRTDADGVTVNDQTGTLVSWDVTNTDTYYQCRYGKAELRYYLGTGSAPVFLVKSDIYKTVVENTLGAALAEAPVEEANWLDTLLDASRRLDSLDLDDLGAQISAAQTAAQDAALSAQTIGDVSQRLSALESDKVDKSTGKGLSTNDYTDADKAAVATIGDKVDKVIGKVLSDNNYTNADKVAVETIWNKVDKVPGKDLSTRDYTTAEKNKLAGIPADATNNTGTITGITMNGVSKGTSGVVDLGTVITDVSGKLDASRVGTANGVAELDANGKVPSAQLPAYVDDVLEYASLSAFPESGETGKIYVAIDTNVTYRWSGSAYVVIGSSLALGETSSTACRGDRGKIAYDHSQTTGNAHNMTKADIGLGNVPNVATNDQTPTYTAASALAALASGENLSVAFGKIAKGISDLISHLADNVKHITAAERTAWNNKVDKVTGKGLSTNDYTDADKVAVETIWNKVDKVTGKGLSTNDYTTAEKTKLSGIAAEANKTIIDSTLSSAGQAADAKATGDSLAALEAQNATLRKLVNGIDADIYLTETGNPVTFSDAKAANLKALSVTLTPVQSGSGDPSPTNIRPITGVSSVTVTRTGENGANSQSVTISLVDSNNNPLTVYGGTLDMLTGTLTVNQKRVVIGEQTWRAEYVGGGNSTHFVSQTNRPVFMYSLDAGVSSCYPKYLSVWQSRAYDYGIVIASNEWTGSAYYGRTAIRDTRYSTVADFVAAMGDQSYTIPIATETYHLTPQQLATLSGYNAVSSDAGTLDVTYKVDTVLSLGGRT